MDRRTRQGTRAQASGQRSSGDCIWSGVPGKWWLSEKALEPGVSGDPFSRTLLPEGEAGSEHGVACGHMHLGVLAWAGPTEPEMWAAAAPGSLM